jgi:hypothetical protein
MDDVVDLDEVLDAAIADVRGREVVRLEPVHVALVDIDRRSAVDEPLGRGPGNARGMGDPHGLGDPEAGHVP